jgi:hypothetical protein
MIAGASPLIAGLPPDRGGCCLVIAKAPAEPVAGPGEREAFMIKYQKIWVLRATEHVS